MYGKSGPTTGLSQNQQQNRTIKATKTATTATTTTSAVIIPTITTNNNNNNITTDFSKRGGCLTSIDSESSLRNFSSISAYSTCSALTPTTKVTDPASLESCNPPANATTTQMTLLTHRRRRLLQRHACLLSILAAFVVGLILGVLAPMVGMSHLFAISSKYPSSSAGEITHLPLMSLEAEPSSLRLSRSNHKKVLDILVNNQTQSNDEVAKRPPSDFPTIYDGLQVKESSAAHDGPAVNPPYSVAFVEPQNDDLPAEEVFRNAFHLEQDKNVPNSMIVKKLDTQDGSIKEFRVERLSEGRFRKGPEKRLSKPSLSEMLQPKVDKPNNPEITIVPLAARIMSSAHSDNRKHGNIIKSDIYWGDLIEKNLPKGFNELDAKAWNNYVTTEGVVTRFEPGCGRMQNRLVIFADGTRACARYRQNTDQIQGEIFSFYLGQLLNISNLAPSAATVVDLDSRTWSSALTDITQAQWKQQRPVVLTRWLSDLEPAGIPQPFQPLERHLNKYDVWNITLSGAQAQERKRDGKSIEEQDNQSPEAPTAAATRAASSSSSLSSSSPTPATMQRLVELAQWSDLIVFDYLIANLDRVVNNLYNFQWNADIMAAPAHNLARQTDSQLLVFLDNESGLLHGYRLLKKYEAYHGVLLDNLCVFRQPTIDALRQLRANGAGRKLREIFERTTSNSVRDVLPSLPDKSIKILVDRIDRVLGQVQKCKDLLADR